MPDEIDKLNAETQEEARKMLEAIRATGKETYWKSAENVFRWWMEDKNVEGQISLELEEE